MEMLIKSYLSAFDPFIILLLHIYLEAGYSYVSWLNKWDPWSARFFLEQFKMSNVIVNSFQRIVFVQRQVFFTLQI